MRQSSGYIFIVIATLLYSCTFGRVKKIDTAANRMDYSSWGHSKLNLFIYKVHQTDSNKGFIREDTLGLFCTDVPTSFDSLMTQTQWQFLTTNGLGAYRLDQRRYTNYYEGTRSTKEEFFLHPARSCFKELQMCPYPYLLDTCCWDWDFTIGASWGVEPLYPIKTTENFHIDYKWEQETEQINTPLGKMECARLNAVSKSVFGTSYASYYVNREHGLVYFTVSPVNKQAYEFSLLKKISERDEIAKVFPYFISSHYKREGLEFFLFEKNIER